MDKKISHPRTLALVFVLLVSLAACQEHHEAEDWYLSVSDPSVTGTQITTNFGSDKAKCEDFAARYTKHVRPNVSVGCVTGRHLAQQGTNAPVPELEQSKKADVCPPGYTAMSERDYCFTAKGVIVPKIKDSAATHETITEKPGAEMAPDRAGCQRLKDRLVEE